MKYTDRVLRHPIYLKFIKDIHELEADRIYCCHKLEHGTDVARMAWIYYLEDKLSEHIQKTELVPAVSYGEWTDTHRDAKDLIYTCALLHDIGRVAQYETGIHHAISGIEPAKQILQDIKAPAHWIPQILDVIAEHAEDNGNNAEKDLEYYIAKADHDCRLCFACQAKNSCKWTDDEMNHTIVT